MKVKQIASIGTTLAAIILPALAMGQQIVKFLTATSDKAGSILSFCRASAQTTVDATSAAGQAVVNVTATVFDGVAAVATDKILCFSQAGAFILTITSVQAGISLTATGNIPSGKGLVAGDKVFLIRAATDVVTYPVGAATVTLENAFATDLKMPGYLFLDGTSLCNIGGLVEEV
jgi:hypothetical protein